jgi:hypothetical protein
MDGLTSGQVANSPTTPNFTQSRTALGIRPATHSSCHQHLAIGQQRRRVSVARSAYAGGRSETFSMQGARAFYDDVICLFDSPRIISRLFCLIHLKIWNGTKKRNTDTTASAPSSRDLVAIGHCKLVLGTTDRLLTGDGSVAYSIQDARAQGRFQRVVRPLMDVSLGIAKGQR